MALRLLAGIQVEQRTFRVFRVAVAPRDVLGIAVEDELDPRQAAELAALDLPLNVLDTPFDPSRFSAGRFSDGTFGVLYSAEDLGTARREKGYWVAKLGGPNTIEYFGQWSAQFSGHLKDLMPFDSQWVELTHDNHRECQDLARQARAENLDALRSPSARNRPAGVCVPAFTRSSLSALQGHGMVEICVEAGALRFEEMD